MNIFTDEKGALSIRTLCDSALKLDGIEALKLVNTVLQNLGNIDTFEKTIIEKENDKIKEKEGE